MDKLQTSIYLDLFLTTPDIDAEYMLILACAPKYENLATAATLWYLQAYEDAGIDDLLDLKAKFNLARKDKAIGIYEIALLSIEGALEHYDTQTS